MPRSLSAPALRRLRVASQRLAPRLRAGSGPAEVCSAVLGLQAQQTTAFPLGVRVRSRGLGVGDLHRARVEERSVIRTWCMRGTVHLLATEDVGWLLPLVAAPRRPAARRRVADFGVQPERAMAAVDRALAKAESLTRDELIAAASSGVRTAADPQLGYWVAGLAALEGIACAGWEEGGRNRFVRLADWAGVELREPDEAAFAELARRFLSAYGPARPEDLAYWAGLPLGRARSAWAAIGGELTEVAVGAEPMWRLTSGGARASRGGPAVSLLPAFDTYLLGYRSRDHSRAPEHERRILSGGGMISAVVGVDGWAVAGWTLQRDAGRVTVAVDPWETLAPAVTAGLEAETADIGRFLDVPAELTVSRPIPPASPDGPAAGPGTWPRNRPTSR